MNNFKKLKDETKKLPDSPGIYIMKDFEDKIIYIGKAKNLKNRVSSYFVNDACHSEKVKKMVSNIDRFDYIVTNSEFEALVLECSLIKKHQPKYNILLKDDKGFSYIKVTADSWPKIVLCKKKDNDTSQYIGPYMNTFYVKKIIEEVNKIFKLPTCNRNLDKKFRNPCLNYHINRCCGVCIRKIPRDGYIKQVKDAVRFIKNGSEQFLKELKTSMNSASENLEFERAAEIRDKIRIIESLNSKQKVVSYKVKNQDVIACVSDNKTVSFEVFIIRDGDLCENKSYIVDVEENLIKTRTEFIKSYYNSPDLIPKVLVLDGEIEGVDLIRKYFLEFTNHKVEIVIPVKGEQLKLVQMCKTNAEESFLRSKNNSNKYMDILEELKNILNISHIPTRIEAYDISNTMGKNNVGGMVVYENCKPKKSDYRKFSIKSVEGQDDYASMKEVIFRRMHEYFKLKDTGSNDSFSVLPDLILVDGGKMHTSAVKEILKNLSVDIPVFGMVKDSKHRTRAITSENREINIKQYDRVFRFITKVQDEVHRFAIGYHKKLRNKNIYASELEKIDGVGKTRAKELIKKFGSIQNISYTTLEEIKKAPTITSGVAKNIYKYFHKK